MQLICVESAQREAGSTKVKVADFLRHLERLDPLSRPSRAKCKRILNKLEGDGLVKSTTERGYALTAAGAEAVAAWRSRKR